MKNAIFYHAGCPVCVEAEQKIVGAIDKNKYAIKVVHLGEEREQLAEAKNSGVKSVPALVLDGTVLHINFGASITDLE